MSDVTFYNRCSAELCANPAHRMVLCSMHYKRFRKHGETFDRGPARTAPGSSKTFLELHRTYDGKECLIWPYSRSKDTGYPYAYVGGRTVRAHRQMCILAHGPAPFKNAHAAHRCGNGRAGCVAPNHLYWATPIENADDKEKHGSTLREEAHPCAVLTNEQVVEIYKTNEPHREIARRFRCSTSTVSAIKSGQNWATLTGHTSR